ncbi:uncharacterized protein LOC107495080 isoform X1 [Arachis duranensis]|uniref:Uncharacterized protein LOC107495080 isoform X1 n=1 Tax=Arachis duranensis TaxID=130453 RepID=A0A9C6TFW9_ARADU|nr:uncharacterized protein LOC107495080 isoform X1 [Arachis duranensis]
MPSLLAWHLVPILSGFSVRGLEQLAVEEPCVTHTQVSANPKPPHGSALPPATFCFCSASLQPFWPCSASGMRLHHSVYQSLLSLSSVKDMLISLKLLIFQRAKTVGYADLAKKFNLKIIRAIAVVLMEHLKEELKDLLLVADTDKSASFLDACKLLKCYKEGTTTIEELITDIGTDIQAYVRRFIEMDNRVGTIMRTGCSDCDIGQARYLMDG